MVKPQVTVNKSFKFHHCLLAVVLFCLPTSLLAQFHEELLALDKVKTKNFAQFSSDLDRLSTRVSEMSKEELDYYNFLLIYQEIYLKGFSGLTTKIDAMLADDLSAALKFRVSALAVNAHLITKDFKTAFSYTYEILRSFDEINDPFTQRQVIAPLANLFIDIRQKDIATYYIEQLRRLSQDDEGRCFADYLEFKLQYELGEFTYLSESAAKGVNSCELADELLWRDLIYVHWIKTLLNQSDLEKSSELISKIESSGINSSYPLLVAMTHAVQAEFDFASGNYEQSLMRINLAFDKAGFNDSNPALLWANDTAYRLYQAQGDYQNALKYYIIFKKIEQKLDREKADQQFAFELGRNELEVKNQRIALLDKDNEVLSLQKDLFEQEAKQNRLLIVVLAFILVVSSTLAYRGMTGRKRFKKIAEYDQLTGISNRYHFNNQATVALDYCEKNAKAAAVILFDLDYFKTINDTHGHAAGDWALQAVVKTCRNFMRNNDVFGRIGGEEFAVVLPGCHTDKAVLLAEICRDAIAAIDTAESGKDFPLTASFGVCGSDTSGYQLKQLLADADHAMYQAKEAGRNTVAAFSDYRSVV